MPHDLFSFQPSIIQEHAIRNYIAVVSVNDGNHLIRAFHNFFVFSQPFLSPLALSDIVKDSDKVVLFRTVH